MRLPEDYEKRLADEGKHFADLSEVHALPPIHHYWANKYIRPVLVQFGFNLPAELFAKYIDITARSASRPVTVLSLGAGNCDTEVQTALLLREAGLAGFVIECLELNPQMLERGRKLAFDSGVSEHLIFTEGDLNRWEASRGYSIIIANQSLHHVIELERLFGQVKSSLSQDGYFVVTDIIGRNGHQRWPEAMELMRPFWRELPLEYRWNRLLNRFEEDFLDHDCSAEGFEGIRAQDILPLLISQFDFQLFVAFANIIDAFVDRSFGYNFDGLGDWDRAFIDRVHAFDEQSIVHGDVTPTHMIAAMTPQACAEHYFARGLAPEKCVRRERQAAQRGLEITTAALYPSEAAGRSFSMALSAFGGSPPYLWEASSLPPGLTMSPRGELRGFVPPATIGTPLIVLTDSSSPAQKTSQRYTILEAPCDRALPLTLPRSGALPRGVAGLEYAEAIPVDGGAPPYVWSIAEGTLPGGLELDAASGVLSGEPIVTPDCAFTVRVSDALGNTATTGFDLNIDPPEPPATRSGVFPHLAFGGGWNSSILIVNQSPVRVVFAICLRSSRGRRVAYPLDPPPNECRCHETGHYTLAPHGSQRIAIAPNYEESISCWAEVVATGPVMGCVTFSHTTPKGTRSEVTTPLEHAGSPELLIPFDNEEGNQTGLALLNLSDKRPDALAATFWSADGGLIMRSALEVDGGGHEAFMLPARFPETAQRSGVVVVRAVSGGDVCGVALRLSAGGIFTSLPARR